MQMGLVSGVKFLIISNVDLQSLGIRGYRSEMTFKNPFYFYGQFNKTIEMPYCKQQKITFRIFQFLVSYSRIMRMKKWVCFGVCTPASIAADPCRERASSSRVCPAGSCGRKNIFSLLWYRRVAGAITAMQSRQYWVSGDHCKQLGQQSDSAHPC